jgi:hypothetical protein
MSLLDSAVELIIGRRCKKLVKRTGNQITLSTGIDAGVFKINVGNFSNLIREIVNIPDTAVALDDTQYHLCTAISDMKDIPQLKEKCIAIRLQLIVAFNQLRAILASIEKEPTQDLKGDLEKWVRYMNELHFHSISVLAPTAPSSSQPTTTNNNDSYHTTLEEIREYQRIEERQLQEAVNKIK